MRSRIPPRLARAALIFAIALGIAFLTAFLAGLWDGGEEPVDLGGGPPERIRVEVLNGAGRPGIAREATIMLRDQGYDVVYFGNARDFGWDSSVVIDRVGREAAAQTVARALGITKVESRPDSTLLLEVTVVLGKDWGEGEAGSGIRDSGIILRPVGRRP